MIYAKDRILAELDSAGAQLASLAADLKASRAVLQARRKRPPPFMPLEEYDCHFANAFTHIETDTFRPTSRTGLRFTRTRSVSAK